MSSRVLQVVSGLTSIKIQVSRFLLPVTSTSTSSSGTFCMCNAFLVPPLASLNHLNSKQLLNAYLFLKISQLREELLQTGYVTPKGLAVPIQLIKPAVLKRHVFLTYI